MGDRTAIAISNCKFIIKSTKSATPIEINTIHDQSDGEKQSAQNLHVLRCQLVNITIDATYIHSRISIAENTITGTLKINFAEVTNEDGLLERTPHPSDRILIRNNVIYPRDDDEPIRITNYTDTEITKLFSLHNNRISRTDDFSTLHTLEYKYSQTSQSRSNFRSAQLKVRLYTHGTPVEDSTI